MSALKRVVFFGAAPGIYHVAGPVFKAIEEEYHLTQTEIIIDSKPVLKHRDEAGDEFYFVRTDAVVCHEYDRYLPILLRYFADFDMAGLITWHEGHNAPDRVFSVHTAHFVKDFILVLVDVVANVLVHSFQIVILHGVFSLLCPWAIALS